jgi:hypothetical protein
MRKEYLPSKQFMVRTGVLIAGIVVIFSIYKISVYFKNKSDQKDATMPLNVKDIVQKDSNKNGIPDWEETLWGLDPQGDGPSNKEFISIKKQALTPPEEIGDKNDEKPLSENENLSREFFAVIMSLQQTNNLDSISMQAIADAIGKKIVASSLADIYIRSMLTIKETTSESTSNYFDSFKNLTLAYKDKNIGDELIFIAEALQNNDPQALEVVKTVATAYRSFGKELVKIPVPVKFAGTHLSLANNYEKTAQSIEGLAHILTDQITGMKALINYKKYSDALVADIKFLSDNLE